MPMFYGGPDSNTSDEQPAYYIQEQYKRRTILATNIGSRSSVLPEAGTVTPVHEDGRPISRGDIIERLKSQNWANMKEKDMAYEQSAQDQVSATAQSSITGYLPMDEKIHQDMYSSGLDIARPRSALHAGDFQQESGSVRTSEIPESSVETSRSQNRTHHLFSILHRRKEVEPRPAPESGSSATPPFSLLPPTSPLIHTSINTDLDTPHGRRSPSPNRRHSFSPFSKALRQSASGESEVQRSSPSHAYQAHQPQRPISIPQVPRLRPRGISSSSEASPLQHAPMVGSYEESILRGRMSTTPSRPLDFIAQLGVLGKGKCKPSLRCPPHVTVPFPAVFYSYNSVGVPTDNSPSPYVGLIDIENTFPDYEGKAPAGGCYRIPSQGQLQIIIKNPNKTAVKLFLVPYDVTDMEPGTKTFIRQRSYSAGLTIDMPISARKNLGTDRPEAAISASEDPLERPRLRYLIHLHICSPARGRYFLYRSIRVVFASRVPEGNEKLRNEVQLPEPRYSPYKPGTSITSSPRVGLHRDSSGHSPTSHVYADVERRQSIPFAFVARSLEQADGLLRNFTLPRANPPSAAALQRRFYIPLQQLEAETTCPVLSRDEGDVAASQSKSASDTPPVSDEVIMDPFDTWVSKRRRNVGTGDDG